MLKFSLESLVDRVVDLGCFGTMSEGNKPRTRSVVEGLPGSPSRYPTRSAAGVISPKQVDSVRRGAIPRAANKKNEEKEGQAYLIIDGTDAFVQCLGREYERMTVPKVKNPWSLLDHNLAMNATKAYMKFVLEKINEGKSSYSDDSSDSESSADYPLPNKQKKKVASENSSVFTQRQQVFIEKLPTCLPLHWGFDPHPNTMNSNNSKLYCPCCKAVQPWRETHNLDDEYEFDCKHNKEFKSSKGLLDHLRDQGVVHTGKVFSKPMSCFFHYAACIYLRLLIQDWRLLPHLRGIYQQTIDSMKEQGHDDEEGTTSQQTEASTDPQLVEDVDEGMKDNDQEVELTSHLDSSDEELKEKLQLGDVINYYLTIDTAGTEGRMRKGSIIEIKDAKEIYACHLVLDNNDTIRFFDLIQRVVTDDDGNPVPMPWRMSNRYICTPGQIDGAIEIARKRASNQFKSIVENAQETFYDQGMAQGDSQVEEEEVELEQYKCAVGSFCRSTTPNENFGHDCYGCKKRLHSSVLCGMNLEGFISKYPQVVGVTLPSGVVIQNDNDNEEKAVCQTCINKILSTLGGVEIEGGAENEPNLEEEVPITSAKMPAKMSLTKSKCWIQLIEDRKNPVKVTPEIRDAKNGSLFPIIRLIDSKGRAYQKHISWEACVIKKVDSDSFDVLNADMTAIVENDLEWFGENGLFGNWNITYKYPTDAWISEYKVNLEEVSDLHAPSTQSDEEDVPIMPSTKSNRWIELIEARKNAVVRPEIEKATNGSLFPLISRIDSKGNQWQACIVKKLDSDLFEVFNADMMENLEDDIDWDGDDGLRGNWKLYYKYPSDEWISDYKSAPAIISEEVSDVPAPTIIKSDIHKLVDQLYSDADVNTVTTKDILKSVRIHFGLTKLSSSEKEIVKDRLRELNKEKEKIPNNENHESNAVIDTTSPARNPNFSYHDPFTFYQRFYKTEAESFAEFVYRYVQPNGLVLLKRKKNSAQESLNNMVESWNKKRDEKSVSVQVEDVPGDDGFSSQSHFGSLDFNQANPFLPLIQDRPRRIDLATDDLKKMFEDLISSVKLLMSSDANNDHLSTISQGRTANSNIVHLEAKKFVSSKLDDVELVDWVSVNEKSSLWHCSDLSKSPLLLSAIELALMKCPYKHSASFLNTKHSNVLQYIGFVTAHITKNKLVSFHMHSFCVYVKSENGNRTDIYCLMTGRNFILSNMQERLLQILQMLQYRHTKSWSIKMTNRYLGPNSIVENSKYLLSDKEEVLISKFSQTSSSAWGALQAELTSNLKVEIDGKEISLSQARNLAHDKDSEVRRKGYDAEMKAYPKIAPSIAYAMNGVKGEVNMICELRGFESALDQAVHVSRMERPTLDALISSMKDYLPHFHEYLNRKAELFKKLYLD